ncbi:MarR family transcriptional regulator [Pseudonocardia sp. CNS-139]|nr:MarR family transcriptional regulator [Pseudonocardia sp. CNS-139]
MTTENDPAPTRPPGTSPSIVVLTLAHRVEAELGAALAPLGLTVSRLGLLGHISGVPGASFSDLARMSGVTVQTVHTAVKALAGAGLVRDATARAGSASALELTAAGRALLAEARAAITTVDTQLFGPDADPVQRRLGEAIATAFAELQAD